MDRARFQSISDAVVFSFEQNLKTHGEGRSSLPMMPVASSIPGRDKAAAWRAGSVLAAALGRRCKVAFQAGENVTDIHIDQTAWPLEKYEHVPGKGRALNDERREEDLAEIFPPIEPKIPDGSLPIVEDKPFVITDSEDFILCCVSCRPTWFNEKQEDIIQARSAYGEAGGLHISTDESVWRCGPKLFNLDAKNSNPGIKSHAGQQFLSPAAIPQGTSLRKNIAETKSYSENGTSAWLQSMARAGAVFDGIMRVTCPAQHCALRAELDELARREPETAGLWCFPTQACHLISNRETIFHCDTGDGSLFYDMVATVGDYGRGAYMGYQSLGFAAPYNSGNAQVFLAKHLSHGVPEVSGDRVCIALFCQRGVLKAWGIDQAGKEYFPLRVDDFVVASGL
ncbi:uncharacterized protein BXZ73DRAFT_80541 [Epithele typhae]|uniref:uncharacterized protein n=1 Tax=Epithele typhae TaxID=378194 RepID=UPI002007D083|nr:uncharacterized protein BXZ73DRAFT_80541 [Epithele typhae]KAH9918528.1 hypothetical protein BXZ73DRAFT_80541 [Epithele typhae]